ncbi:MAG: type IV secretion system DNA-binding domain-containing protein [bacterium]
MADDENDIVYFARTNFRNQQRRFGVKLDDRRRHMYFIGKTGMGKTTVLENMMIQDVQQGHGLAVIDPHGDFVEKILDFIPPHRINDVVYINPADVEYPVAFNVLEAINPTHRILVASGLLSVFKKMWIDSWGPRLEYILRICILSLLEYPGSTLLGIPRLLVDNEYRHKVVEKIQDPIVKSFWVEEYSQYQEKFRTEAIAPIQNKIGQFLSSSLIRNIVGQPKSSLDLRALMDNNKILLLNLAKGRIGEDNAGLLGGMMITKLQLAAMSRVDIPEIERKDFFLYVDEFQNFATESFANILSEARKYRLDLIIAHQYIEQLDENVAAAVFGNVGTIVCFRVGATDAEFLAKEFAPIFDETDLVNLTKYDVYLRLMIDGVASDPFSATTLPPISGRTGNRETVINVSRERYAVPREVIEEKIRRWTGVDEIFLGQARDTRDSRRPMPPRGNAPSRERRDERREHIETPPPKMEELEPIIVDTGEKEISLSQALGKELPQRGEHGRNEESAYRQYPRQQPSSQRENRPFNQRQQFGNRGPQQRRDPQRERRDWDRRPPSSQHGNEPQPPRTLRPGEVVKP